MVSSAHGKRRQFVSLIAASIALGGIIGESGTTRDAALQSGDVAQSSETRRLWRHEDAKNLDHVTLTATGALVIATDERLALLDGETGRVRWARTDVTDCGREQFPEARYQVRCKYRNSYDLGFVFEGREAPVLVGHNPGDGQISMIDLADGETIYDSDGRSTGKTREYWYSDQRGQLVMWVDEGSDRFALTSVARSGETLWRTPTSVGKNLAWLGTSSSDALLVYGKDRSDKRVVAELDLESGTVIWESTGVLRDDVDDGPRMIGGGGSWRRKPYRFDSPVSDSPSSVVLFINKDGPMRFARDGTLLWQVRDLAGEHPSMMHLSDGAIYLIQKGEVYAIDAASGKVLWTHEPRSNPIGLEVHPLGILVWSGERLVLLDARTGRSPWARDAQLPDSWDLGWSLDVLFRPQYSGSVSPRLVAGDVAYVAGYQTLASIDIRDGTMTTLATYSLQDREPIRSMELVGDELALVSAQSIVRFARDGRQIFRKDYKPVGASAWVRAAAVGLSFLGARTSYSTFNPLGSVMYRAFRHRDSTGAGDETHACFLFDNGNGDEQRRFGVTCAQTATGRDIGTLWVNTRDPNVLLDSTSGTLFFQDTGKSVLATRFETAAAVEPDQ